MPAPPAPMETAPTAPVQPPIEQTLHEWDENRYIAALEHLERLQEQVCASS
jgi:hypothetical protein